MSDVIWCPKCRIIVNHDYFNCPQCGKWIEKCEMISDMNVPVRYELSEQRTLGAWL